MAMRWVPVIGCTVTSLGLYCQLNVSALSGRLHMRMRMGRCQPAPLDNRCPAWLALTRLADLSSMPCMQL